MDDFMKGYILGVVFTVLIRFAVDLFRITQEKAAIKINEHDSAKRTTERSE